MCSLLEDGGSRSNTTRFDAPQQVDVAPQSLASDAFETGIL